MLAEMMSDSRAHVHHTKKWYHCQLQRTKTLRVYIINLKTVTMVAARQKP